LEELLNNDRFAHIGTIDLSWFPEAFLTNNSFRSLVHNEIYKGNKNNSIQILFSKRNPSELLTGM
jgi:hypothetical protein